MNLVGFETESEIVGYYREKFQGNSGKVAICVHRLHEYNDACDRTDIKVLYEATRSQWEFNKSGKAVAAYKHRPVTVKGGRGSPSHSGVEYVSLFDELAAQKFTRRMCRKKFHLR